MKRILLPLVLPFLLCSCSTLQRASNFAKTIPAVNVSEVKQDFSSPLWSNSEVATGVKTQPDGTLKIDSASASLKIPLWGVVSSASLNGLEITPTPAQVAAGGAIATAARAAVPK